MSRDALNNELSFRAKSRNLASIKLMDAGSLYFAPSTASHSSPSDPVAEEGVASKPVATLGHVRGWGGVEDTDWGRSEAEAVLKQQPSAAEGVASQWLAALLRQKGGKVFEKDGEIWWDHSDAFHSQLITARVEASGKRFVASCKEGSAATPLLQWTAWILFLALSAASVWWLRSGWCAAIIFVLLLVTLWVVLRPAQKSVRRMIRLAEELHG